MNKRRVSQVPIGGNGRMCSGQAVVLNYPKSSSAFYSCSDASACAAPLPRSGGCVRGSPRTAGRLPPACGRCSCRCRSACEIGRAQSELQSRLHLVCRLLLEKKKDTARRRSSPPKNNGNHVPTL